MLCDEPHRFDVSFEAQLRRFLAFIGATIALSGLEVPLPLSAEDPIGGAEVVFCVRICVSHQSFLSIILSRSVEQAIERGL